MHRNEHHPEHDPAPSLLGAVSVPDHEPLEAPSGAPRALPFRLLQLVVGCMVLGVGLGLLLRAQLGMDPFGMLLEGLSAHLGISFGLTNALFGIALALLCWRPGGVVPGIGTIVLPLAVGPAADLTLWLVDAPDALAARLGLALAGALLTGVGAGVYLGASLGSGPFDSVPFALHRIWPGRSLALMYAGTLAVTLVLGVLSGGRLGVMTVVLMLGLGPLVALSREHTLTCARPRPQPCPGATTSPAARPGPAA